MSETTELATVPVHVTNAHEMPGAARQCPHCGYLGNPRRNAQCRTIVLNPATAQAQTTGGQNVQELLPEDPARCHAMVQSLDHLVILAHSKSQAQAATNLTDTSLLTPEGTVLGNSSSFDAWVPVEGQNRMFVSSPQNSACRVTVISYIHQG